MIVEIIPLAVYLHVCLGGSVSAVQAQMTSPFCYHCKDKNCAAVESFIDLYSEELDLWSRNNIKILPPCYINSSLPAKTCLVCKRNQQVYAVCGLEITKPSFESKDEAMTNITKINCSNVFDISQEGVEYEGQTMSPDINVTTSSAGDTESRSKGVKIAFGVELLVGLLILTVISVIIVP
ncbi:hypothetical protein UPYG_G00156000 [Umbra pygmaea]|uniref:Uncharacterized protein n=1 Tax=Umbra pygmaea TaxID=75934 RepID=A0ABD0WZF5_UMBPY